MPLADLTDANFDELTEKYELMIIDFWASWCGPCRLFEPTYEQAARRHPEILFGRIDTEVETAIAKQFEIFSVPTIITAKAGVIVSARPGALSPEKLENLIQDLRKTKVEEE